MSEINIRDAKKSDAADLALLDNIAGHGISLWFWTSLTETNRYEDALSLGRDRLAADDAFYGWRNARLAVEDDMVLGMANSYIMPPPSTESDEMKEHSDAFKPVFDLYDSCAGEWFIDCLAVYPSAQGNGVGKLLFEDSMATGEKSDAATMSLVVEDTNHGAAKLYRSYGFEVVDSREFIPFEGCVEINEWLLMRKDFA